MPVDSGQFAGVGGADGWIGSLQFPECIVGANKCGLREDFLIDTPFTLR
jgi:hypothetical protein